MKNIIEVEHAVVERVEKLRKSNVILSAYNIPNFCPTNEVRCYRAILEKEDISRLFLLGLTEFEIHTTNGSWKLADVMPSAWEIENNRVSKFRDNNIDIRIEPDYEVILFSKNLEKTSSLVAFDGNHRLMAHFLMYGNISDVPAFIYTHENINNWSTYSGNPFIPRLAY